eukprot:CAMPEP_0168314280 /NCGR_PEP_ID=MMETSP0210-20121227/7031_1 /TAXON_ID=40633 /ORGANISM="Condylostoma magnum, Strain COL2" /LENGTH=60 /DNA_ID=CAMNT_0008280175 /DNA_START=6627 /DNA_END=6809 /DNA_ORIENTATION=+
MANQETLNVLLGFYDIYAKSFAKDNFFAVSLKDDYIPVTEVCPDLNAKDIKLSTVLTDSS